MFRALCLSAVLCFAAALSVPGYAEPAATAADPARLAAARDLMEVTGVTRQLDGMVQAMTHGFAKGAETESPGNAELLKSQFQSAMQKFMGYKEEMLADFAALYAATFTAEEMKAVADFYRSGAGAKFIQSMPEMMQKGSEIGIKYSMRAQSEMQKEAAPPAADKK